MTVLFTAGGVLACRETGDPAILVLTLAGVLASIIRLGVVVEGLRASPRITTARIAAAYERRFAISYIAFAILLSLFAVRMMMLDHVGLHMITAALVVGYAAGVAAGISLRPRICAVSLIISVAPPAFAAIATLETHHVALGLILLALLGGGLQSVGGRYRLAVEKIENRRTLAGLARRDHLTGLPNRFGLIEHFNEATSGRGADRLIAVHALDLDRFKPVNDRHGHPTGDALLRLVAARLAGCLRSGDLAARTGGDEFVVIQCGLKHPDEADLLARRIVRALREPFHVAQHVLTVGVSVGYVVSRGDSALDDLLSHADNALYAVKDAGGGVAAHSVAGVMAATAS